jgi:hypothetical protein
VTEYLFFMTIVGAVPCACPAVRFFSHGVSLYFARRFLRFFSHEVSQGFRTKFFFARRFTEFLHEVSRSFRTRSHKVFAIQFCKSFFCFSEKILSILKSCNPVLKTFCVSKIPSRQPSNSTAFFLWAV